MGTWSAARISLSSSWMAHWVSVVVLPQIFCASLISMVLFLMKRKQGFWAFPFITR